MNKLLMVIIATVCLVAIADDNQPVSADEIIAETLKVIASEGWTAKDVAGAVKSLRGLYVRENATAEGRKRWHGKIVSTSVDTNRFIRVTVHEDGETFEDAAKISPSAESVAESNARLERPVITNGIPAKLAAARLRRRAEIKQGVSNVTMTVTAGGKR